MSDSVYNQKYYAENRDRLKADVKTYRRKNRKKINQVRRKKYAANPHKILCRNKRWQRSNKEKILMQKRLQRLRQFGLSSAELAKAERALREHDGECGICWTKVPGGMGGWLADHNHRTKRFRGVLCNKCNALLGFARDQIKILKRAIKYLESTP